MLKWWKEELLHQVLALTREPLRHLSFNPSQTIMAVITFWLDLKGNKLIFSITGVLKIYVFGREWGACNGAQALHDQRKSPHHRFCFLKAYSLTAATPVYARVHFNKFIFTNVTIAARVVIAVIVDRLKSLHCQLKPQEAAATLTIAAPSQASFATEFSALLRL